MTDKYTAYLHMLETRDTAIVSLALLALGVILAWEALRWLPPDWVPRLRPAYLIGGGLLYTITLIVLFLMPVEV